MTVRPPQMPPPNATYAQVAAIVDELARCGLRHAVTAPGSRNAPISLTLAQDDRIDTVSVIDERAAGFLALGMAKATGSPVAVTCTSGTAAANLLPAVVEAHEARVPLIVLTADRPPELRDVGAGQAIDQLKLFGTAVKWFVEVGNGDQVPDWGHHIRTLASRAWWTAGSGPAGPVHLNLPLRDPLAPIPGDVDGAVWEGRSGGRPWVVLDEQPRVPSPSDVEALAGRMAQARRGVLICGPSVPGIAADAAALAAAAGWPLLAEPTSGLRAGDHALDHVIAHYDPALGSEGFARDHRADLVVRLGDMPTSKALRRWVAECPQVAIDPDATWHEPIRSTETIFQADAALACRALRDSLESAPPEAAADWLDSWRSADAVVGRALESIDGIHEANLLPLLHEMLPSGALVWLSSSMPIRYAESFLGCSGKQLRFLASRGANGIDGVVSAAAGAARASGAPTFLVIGDVALIHDIGGLLAARRAAIDLTIVCVNNGGGGIFDLLPISEHSERHAYVEHIATPTGVDFAQVAALAGLEHRAPADPAELARAVAGGPCLIEITSDRVAAADRLRALEADIETRLADLASAAPQPLHAVAAEPRRMDLDDR